MKGNDGTCPICGGALRRKRVFRRGNGVIIRLLRCLFCRSEMLLPQPPDELLLREYRDYFARRTRYSGSAFPKEDFFRELLLRNSQFIPKGSIDALELGAGGGDFIKAFNGLFPGARVTAVEMNAEAAGNLRGLDCRYAPSPIEEFVEGCRERYDLIFMFDVIEHLREPLFVLGAAAGLLKPGGKIFITAPVVDSVLHRLTGRFWPQYKLEHLYYFSKSSFKTIGDNLGLRVSRLSPLSKNLPVSYLFSVGSHFGPALFMGAVSTALKLLPRALYERRIRLPLGEALVIYEKI